MGRGEYTILLEGKVDALKYSEKEYQETLNKARGLLEAIRSLS